MRLINADELSRDIRIQLNSCDGDYERALLNITLKVNYSKGIKAIPLEWIEMFMQRYKIEGGNEYKLLHFMVTEWKKWEKEND